MSLIENLNAVKSILGTCKRNIASAITSKRVPTNDSSQLRTYAMQVAKISGTILHQVHFPFITTPITNSPSFTVAFDWPPPCTYTNSKILAARIVQSYAMLPADTAYMTGSHSFMSSSLSIRSELTELPWEDIIDAYMFSGHTVIDGNDNITASRQNNLLNALTISPTKITIKLNVPSTSSYAVPTPSSSLFLLLATDL
jgi:hypothetical protein